MINLLLYMRCESEITVIKIGKVYSLIYNRNLKEDGTLTLI